jgi:hypothetical protein
MRRKAQMRRNDSPRTDTSTADTNETYRVPNLKLNLFVVNGDHARPKLHANGKVMHRLEALVGELQEET